MLGMNLDNVPVQAWGLLVNAGNLLSFSISYLIIYIKELEQGTQIGGGGTSALVVWVF